MTFVFLSDFGQYGDLFVEYGSVCFYTEKIAIQFLILDLYFILFIISSKRRFQFCLVPTSLTILVILVRTGFYNNLVYSRK